MSELVREKKTTPNVSFDDLRNHLRTICQKDTAVSEFQVVKKRAKMMLDTVETLQATSKSDSDEEEDEDKASTRQEKTRIINAKIRKLEKRLRRNEKRQETIAKVEKEYAQLKEEARAAIEQVENALGVKLA